MANPETASPVTVAALQMNSCSDVEENLARAEQLIGKAAESAARLAVLPENFAFMGATDAERLAVAEAPGKGPIQDWLMATARRYEIWLVAGTIPLHADAGRCYSSCLVFDPDGTRRARYDKRHLFDVAIPDSKERYRESEATAAGDKQVVCASPVGGLGLSVCYDLRFPEHFRAMLAEGMEVIAVPAAFTRPTGAAHWELLLRARAVENLCPVVAAAQCGQHAGGRETWGHSMIVDAWGVVLARCGEQPGVAVAQLDSGATGRIRDSFPALQHRRH